MLWRSRYEQSAGESLTRWLAPLTFTDWSAARVASELTQAVIAWGAAHQWDVRREEPSLREFAGEQPDRAERRGVVCERPDGPPIIIAIDPTRAPGSAHILLAQADAGAVPVWVRWGAPENLTVPDPVALVTVAVTHRLAEATGRILYSRNSVEIGPPAGPKSSMPPPSSQTADRPQCRATTKQGQPCPIDPRPSGLCHVHDPAVQCGGRTRKGTICTVATGGGRCRYHLDQSQDDPPQAPVWLLDTDMS